MDLVEAASPAAPALTFASHLSRFSDTFLPQWRQDGVSPLFVTRGEWPSQPQQRSRPGVVMNASVVSLVERRAAAADPVLNVVEAYWDGLRAGRIAPARAEVSPRGLSEVLSKCFILERIAPGFARFRVFGRHVGDLMGADLRNIPLSALVFAQFFLDLQ